MGQTQSPSRNSPVITLVALHFRHSLFLAKLINLQLQQNTTRRSSLYGGQRVHNFSWKSMSKLLYVPKSLLFLWNDLPMTLPIPWPQICKRSWRTTLTTFTISLEVHIIAPGVNNTAKLELSLEFELSRGTVPKN